MIIDQASKPKMAAVDLESDIVKRVMDLCDSCARVLPLKWL